MAQGKPAHRKVRFRIWTGRTGRILREHPDAQRMAFYLLTGPASHSCGLYILELPSAAHHVGLTDDEAREAMAVLVRERFAEYDQRDEVVFVCRMAPLQYDTDAFKPTDNKCIALRNYLEGFTDYPLYSRWYERYAKGYQVLDLAPTQGASEGGTQGASEGGSTSSPKPLGKQRERERERERERTRPSEDRGEPLPGKPGDKADKKQKKSRSKSTVSAADSGLARELIGAINRLLNKKPPHLFKAGKKADSQCKALRAMMRSQEIMFDPETREFDMPRLHAVLAHRIEKLRDGDYCTPATLLNLRLVDEWPERMDAARKPPAKTEWVSDRPGPPLEFFDDIIHEK